MSRFHFPLSRSKSALAAVVIATAGAGVALAPLPHAATLSADAPLVSGLPSFAPLVKKVMPAVVNVSAVEGPGAASDESLGQNNPGDQQDQDQDQADPGQDPFQGFPPSPFDQFLKRFFDQRGMGQSRPGRGVQEIALGSGFIIDPAGYVVTNNHVVDHAKKVTVIFQDGTKHPAKIVGRDTKTDLAVLKIDAPKPLPYVSWGDSDASQVGDWVFAVGNPFGLGGSVSPGTIAARGRNINAGPYDDFLQIDASINKGNSGGPTFNLAGQVIGINTAIYSPNGGSVGIGFAIPSDLAKPIVAELREHGKITRGWLGVQVQTVTPALAKSLGLPKDEGALVAQVTPDSPAAKAGFKEGDVIQSFNGHEITKMRDLPIIVAETPTGEAAKVTVWRNGATQQLEPTIAKMPSNPQVAESGGASAGGLTLSSLTPELRRQLHVPASVHGVVVTAVADDSPFTALGLERGDVIQSINQKPVSTPEEATAAIQAAQQKKGGNQQILMLLNRHGVNEYVALSMEGNGGTG
ncbi:MAG TPA: DegQ family serine endoprotease [Stellaceae bacterium]|jgi:serine protease Do|nr:DegQ family serine endoprotease [Stellaceae bacterium]